MVILHSSMSLVDGGTVVETLGTMANPIRPAFLWAMYALSNLQEDPQAQYARKFLNAGT